VAKTQTADSNGRNDQTIVWLLAAGVVGPPLFIGVLLIEGATRPGYNAWRHFGSQLSLSDQGWEQIANFLVCGLLVLGFAIGLRRIWRSGRGSTWGPILLGIFGLSLITAGIFVTGPALGYPPGAPISNQESLHSQIHGLSGLVAFTSLAAACFVLSRRFAGDPQWHGWALYAVVTGVVVALSFVASNAFAVLDMSGVWPNAPTGLVQRIGIIAGWSWVSLLALRLMRQERQPVAGNRSVTP
jgi:hypothetical membrane protein